MAHINHHRQLRTRLSATLDQIIPLQMGGCSFAAFGGTPLQRTNTAVQALARYCGRCGILVLLNSSDREPPNLLEQLLHQLPQSLPDSHRAFRGTPVQTLHWGNYDLLYGLDEAAICQLMLPGENIHNFAFQANNALYGLQAYLEIMRRQFQIDPAPFGAYPFNLNLLHQLVGMPYPALDAQVLRYLPSSVQDPIRSILSRDNVQQQVFSIVHQFAHQFQRFQYLPGDFGAHSRRSICQALRNREILCLRIPNSSPTLMDYVEAELAQLSDSGIPFVLVSAELDLINSPALQGRFLRKSAANSYTGILAESMSNVAVNEEQQLQIFSHYPQILVFQCATNALAEPFSKNCGSYRRREVQQNRTIHWQPFRLFPTHGFGESIVESDERSIRPEELTSLGSGVLLMGKQYGLPEQIHNLKLDRGNLNGLLLRVLPPGH